MSAQTNKSIPLAKVTEHVRGRLQGKGDIPISGVCALDDQIEGALSFVKGTSSAVLEKETHKAAAFLVPENFSGGDLGRYNLIFVKDPFAALVTVIPFFVETVKPSEGISPKAEIHPSARIGSGVSIGAFTSVGPNVEIGDNCIIHPNVTIYPDVRIGQNTIVHSGSVIREMTKVGSNAVIQGGAIIGSEGFGYIPDKDLGLRAVPQVGAVTLADRVDVGANSCIDRATLGYTNIGEGTKIDNLVQVGHNVRIGRHSILCGQVGIAGSVTLGDRVTMAGSSGIADHITVGSDVRIAAKAAVFSDLAAKADFSGHPAIPSMTWHRERVALGKLPELLRRVRALEKKKEDK